MEELPDRVVVKDVKLDKRFIKDNTTQILKAITCMQRNDERKVTLVGLRADRRLMKPSKSKYTVPMTVRLLDGSTAFDDSFA